MTEPAPIYQCNSAGQVGNHLIDEPSPIDHVPAGACRVNQQRGEALHPSVDRDVTNVDTALSQKFLDVALRQSIS